MHRAPLAFLDFRRSMRTAARSRARSGACVAALAVLSSLVAVGCGGSSGGGGAASGAPIKVGVALPLTGNAAAPGADEKAGWLLGLKHAGESVNGRKIETTFVDSAGDPNLAQSVTRKLIEQQQVDMYVMPIFAHVALAVRSYIGARGIPAIQAVSSCYASIPQFPPADNIVIAGATCDNPMQALGQYAHDELGFKHVSTIGMDYAFGWEQIGAFTSTFEGAGGKIDKALWGPITTPDWAPYLLQIPKNTDAIVALMAGAQGPRFLKAYRQYGLKDKVPLLGGGTMTDFLDNLPPQDAAGVVTAMHYADGIDTPENHKFVDAFREATGRTPSYEAEAGYTAALLAVAALKKVGGKVEDREALINALKTTPIQAPRGPVKIDPDTLAPVQNQYIRKVKRDKDRLTNVVVKTYENVPPWYPLDKAQWEQRFAADARARP